MPGQQLFADVALARRIEGADAAVGVESAEIHAKLHPEAESMAEAIAGGMAMFVGVGSPLTQAIGMGMEKPVRSWEMDRLERFFTSRNSGVRIELCPLSDGSLLGELSRRQYVLADFSNMLFRKLKAVESSIDESSPISVQRSAPEEADLWARTVAMGFGEQLAPTSENLAILRTMVARPTTKCVVAWVDGRPAGGGALSVHQGVAAIYGASTVPSFRRLGVQSAIIRSLITLAVEAECDLAYTLTRPGSVSQRNLERQGFRVAYTRCSMIREFGPPPAS